jgi:intein/homing endonuclease
MKAEDTTATWKILIVMMPPRHGKSQTTSIYFPSWYLGKNPDKHIITASYSGELALDFGGKTRGILEDQAFKQIFDVNLKIDEKAKGRWLTDKGGSYTSVGVGGAITGRGANILLIDDPIKNREEAESQLIRNKHWDWFTSCFVAGTPVLMADGCYKNIEDVKVGDRVISFNEKTKQLDAKKVKAVGKQKKDVIYNIKGRYGDVNCTGEHPFYRLPVKRTGRYLNLKQGEWIKASELKPDDRVLFSLKGAKNGQARRKRVLGTRKFVSKELWWLAGFILGDGFISKYKIGIALGVDDKLNDYVISLCEKHLGKTRIVKKEPRTHTFYIDSKKAVDILLDLGLDFKKSKDKDLDSTIFKQPVSNRKAFISGFLSADGHRTGNKTWTIGMASKKLVESIRLLAINSGFLCGLVGKSEFIAQPPGSPKPFLAKAYRLHIREKRQGFYANRISEVKKVGLDYSYNLEVEDYGTFIANGFVVHNTAYTRLEPNGKVILILTRWHLDDLAGRILQNEELSKNTKVIKFPALAEVDEKYRKKGEALWTERYDVGDLESIKKTVGPYDWSALYQQSPILTENQEFQSSWIQYKTNEEVKRINTRNFLTIDTAVSQRESADYCGFCDNSVDENNFWHFKAWKMKLNPKELIDYLFLLHSQRGFEKIGIEKTVYLMAIKPFLDEEMRKRGRWLPIYELEHKQTAKEIRIRALIPYYSSRSIFHITGECRDLEEELISFPMGRYDDTLDSCLVGDTLVATIKGAKKIKDIKIGDKVITPTGSKKVIWSGQTGEKEVITNLNIIGTADHKVFNGSSFDKLDTIAYNNRISKLSLSNQIIWKYKKLLYSMEYPTALWVGKESIISLNQIPIKGEKIQKDFTWRFGNFITTRQWKKALMFTIKTATLITTILKIWSVYRLASTCLSTGKKIEKILNLLKRLRIIWIESDHLQKNGTPQRKESSGTKTTLQSLSWEKKQKETVRNVEVNIKPKLNSQLNIAQENAKVEIMLENGEKNIQTITEKVYNITVEDDHVYYANGILVANCAYQVGFCERAMPDNVDSVINYQANSRENIYSAI